ncbi:MAG: A/G-specific adenine glycosylase [Oscillospiraceae bacterium]|nr:A/G-specific adenine glycosylase [Oscillospiraceae bacterium]
MAKNAILAKLPGALLPWYDAGHRELPWRRDKDPYHIWVSEIMLQQTRVEAVKGYYARFLEKLPTIADLANCDDDVLHKLWEGLGYYSRVRNLKKAARQIAEQYDGIFPDEYSQIRSLPGIGDYTAGAVSSIAFNQKTPAVDGNVLRVLSRLADDDTPIDTPAFKKSAREELEKIYPDRAGDFTQALMELGATLCGPNRLPDCENCPCNPFCLGYRRGTAPSLPKKSPPKQRKAEQKTVLILCCDGRFALEKRPNKGLLAGLWQFPNVPGKLNIREILAEVEKLGVKPKEILVQVERKHVFNHIEWDMCGTYVETANCGGDYLWLTAEEINAQIALPTAFRLFWESADGLCAEKIFLKKPK